MRAPLRVCAALLCAVGLLSLSAVHSRADPAAPPRPAARLTFEGCTPMQDGGGIKVKPFTLVKIGVTGVDPKAALIWDVTPAEAVDVATTAEHLCQFTAPPGKYRVTLLVITQDADGKLRAERLSVPVEIESCCEKPPPPAPKPPQPPAPGKADPWNALGRIYFAPYGCTATVVSPRRADGKWDILTAGHCVDHIKPGEVGTMRFRDGREIKIRFASIHGAFPDGEDLAWCETVESNLDLPFAHIAKENPPPGTKVWHGGYGVDRPGNREEGETISDEDERGQLAMRLSVSSGDSGGGIFRVDTGELVSAVCCGTKTTTWGGSTAKVLKTRPATKETNWKPRPVPERPERVCDADDPDPTK